MNDDDYKRATDEMRQHADVISAQQTQDDNAANQQNAAQQAPNPLNEPLKQWNAGDISYHGYRDLAAKQKRR